jgi:hypothetical protein
MTDTATIRSVDEIQALERELYDRRWYDRSITSDTGLHPTMPDHRSYEGMMKARREVEGKYDDLQVTGNGADDPFEWGYLSGYHAALRWVLGDERHNGDT